MTVLSNKTDHTKFHTYLDNEVKALTKIAQLLDGTN